MISFNSFIPDFLLSNPELIKNWIANTVRKEGKTIGEIQYVFCNDDYLSAVNLKYLQHNTLTDIITFSISQSAAVVSGEIYISIDRVHDNAQMLNLPFQQELDRVIIHGVLHLLGYNDHTDDEKQQMRAKEDYYIHLQA